MSEVMTTIPTEHTLGENDVSPDVSITKTEVFDVDFAKQIVDDKNIPKEEREKLKRILKNRVRGNQHDTTYKRGKHCKHEYVGRMCALRGEGIQGLQKDIRNAITQDYYWDVDMVNAQPILMSQYAERNGWGHTAIEKYIQQREELLTEACEKLNIERWEAKEKVIAMFFGCSLPAIETMPSFFTEELYPELRKIMRNNWELNKSRFKWLEKQPNHYGKALAYILQTEEDACLKAMDRAFAKRKRNLGVYMYDGGLIEKKEGEKSPPTSLLKEIEADVLKETGYSIQLIFKPIKTSLVKKSKEEEPAYVEVPSSVIVDDTFAARHFAKLMGDKIIFDSGVVWVYDEGLWTSENADIKRVITQCGDKLVFKQDDAPLYNYSGIVKKTSSLMDKLPDVLPRNDGYFLSRVHTDIGKLLFPDGVYDFKTATFTPDFDPAIVFTGRMPRKFPEKNQAIVDEIRRISFDEAFADEDNKQTLLHSLMRAFIGDVLRKKFIIGTGWGNCSKGMTATLMHTSMGTLCSDYNGNCLIYKNGSSESARDYGWMLGVVRSRIAIGSEIKVKNEEKSGIAIDGVLVKTFSSGVDTIRMRGLYKDERQYVNKSTGFLFAQDIPAVAPAEKTTLDRLISVEWSYSFVPNPVLPYEKPCDPELAHKYAKAEYGDAFFWLMVEEYEKWRANGFAEPKVSDIVLASRNNLVDVVDYRQELLDAGYEFGDGFVVFKELHSHFQDKTSKTALGRNLKALGLRMIDKKVDGKTQSVYYGIHRKE